MKIKTVVGSRWLVIGGTHPVMQLPTTTLFLRVSVPLCLCVCCCLLAPPLRSAVSSEDEAREADEEDKAEEKANPDHVFEQFTGKVLLYSKDDAEKPEGTVGSFITDKATYLIKLDRAELLETLKTFDGKEATVKGKLRNKGKYLIVQQIVLPGAGYDYKRRPGHL